MNKGEKLKFCKRGHEITIVGRNSWGACNQCILEKSRVDPTKDSRHKQFCPYGHDTHITGRYENGGGCKECIKERKRVDPDNKDSRVRHFCPKGHDTFVLGRYKDGSCAECGREYAKEWRKSHLEEVRQSSKEYYEENRKEILEKNRELKKLWYQNNRDEILAELNTPESKNKKRNNTLKRKFGISLDDSIEKLESQGGKCAICGKTELEITGFDGRQKFGIDHNHITNKIRGILCNYCNAGLGQFFDSKEFLKNAVIYLTKYE